MSITNNIEKIRNKIPKYTKIVAATKTRTIAQIKEVINAGIEIIGENYIQEAWKKSKEFNKVELHCIGHLQTNKVKKAVEIFDMIQTVDALKLGKEIDKRCRNINKIMPILIEVNIGDEKNKTGVTPDKTINLIEELSHFPNIKIKGIMTMSPYFDSQEDYRPYYKKTKQLFDRIKSSKINNINMEILSMGMSNSYQVAIEEGSTMIRLGTVIFGKR
ncbi:MAG: YggS family pyridoxal phosphate-dependent enzyme [Nanoarchaeota archaeon]|nr:YggS family pyridoxal phosphate-dependent enzyme [Nanoarchaeota archaeon]